jgi:hypothetical protein
MSKWNHNKVKIEQIFDDGVILVCEGTLEVDESTVTVRWKVIATFDPDDAEAYSRMFHAIPVRPAEFGEDHHTIACAVAGVSVDPHLHEAKRRFAHASAAAGLLVVARVRAALALP